MKVTRSCCCPWRKEWPARLRNDEKEMNGMAVRGICDRCKDRGNPVTADNGVEFFKTVWGLREWIADVHTKCKTEWLKEHNGTTDLQALPKKQ
jgi:hypothetical protein